MLKKFSTNNNINYTNDIDINEIYNNKEENKTEVKPINKKLLLLSKFSTPNQSKISSTTTQTKKNYENSLNNSPMEILNNENNYEIENDHINKDTEKEENEKEENEKEENEIFNLDLDDIKLSDFQKKNILKMRN